MMKNKIQNMQPHIESNTSMSANLSLNLLKPLNRTYNLRSSDDDQLVVPRVSSKMGGMAFSFAPPPPQLLNCIPLEMKNLNLHSHFGKKKKTLYFSQAFLF